MSTKHTPTLHTPWRCYRCNEDPEDWRIRGADRYLIARGLEKEHAETIVRCVNSHDALVAACRSILNYLEHIRHDINHRGETIAQKDMLRAALADAEPGERG